MAQNDVAWIDVLPSMANFMPQLTRGINSVVPEAGHRAGQQFGSAFGGSAASSVEAASTKMNMALKKVADTAGQVRVAELKLKEAQDSGKASSSQLAAAEERVAAARRRETEANRGLTGATSNMSAAQRRATEESHLAGTATEEHTKKTHGLVGALGGVRGAFAAGFGAFIAIKEATDFMGEAMKEASNMEAQVHRINVIFGEGSEAIQKWAEGAATRIGMSAQVALAGAGRFGTLFTTMGIGQEDAAKMSEKMVTLSADMAAFNHSSPDDAMNALQKAMAGGTRGLRQYGIVLDANMIKEKAHQMGLYSGKGALDVNAKAQATYALVMEKSTRIQGDFVKQGGNVATKQRILSAEWTNAKETLGKLVVGPAMAFVGFLTKVVPLLENAIHFIQENSSWLKPLALGIAAVAVAWKLWTEAIELWEKIIEMSPAMKVVLIITLIVTALVAAYSSSETFRSIVNAAFHAVGDAAKWMWEVVLKPAFAGLVTAWQFVSTAIQYGWTNILKPTWNFLVAAVQVMGAVAHAIWTGISTAWSAMVAAFQYAWTNILHPVFTVIGTVVTVLAHILLFILIAPFLLAWKLAVAAIKLYWDQVLHPVFTAVATIAQWLWNTILKPLFAAIVTGWKALGTAFKWVYDTIILPMWHALQTAATWMWTNVLKPLWALVMAGWKALGVVFKSIYDTVILPVWHALQTAASFMWNSVLKPIWDAMGKGWSALGTGFKWVFDHVIKPLWDSFLHFIGVLRDGFNTAIKAIAGIWDGLKKAMRDPVQWVVDIVWNNGLRSLWNSINNIWGGKDINPFKFAEGGVLPQQLGRPVAAADGAVLPGWSPGRDVHHFYSPTGGLLDLSGGEAVMRPEFTAAVGPAWVDSMNARARAGGTAGVRTAMGFAGGGIVSLGDRALSFMGSGLGQFLTTLLVPGGSLLAHLTDYVNKERGITKNGGSTPIYDVVGDSMRSAANELWKQVKTGVSGFVSSAVADTTASQRAGVIAGGNATAPTSQAANVAAVQRAAAAYGWNTGSMWSTLVQLINRESGFRNTAQNPTSTAYGIFQFLDSTWAGYGIGKTSDAFLQAVAGMRYIKQRYGTPMGAQAHEMAAGWYDTGGLWPHNTFGLNTAGADERVLSPQQDDYFRRFVDATSGHTASSGKRMLAEKIEVHAPSQHQGEQIIDQLWHKLQVADFGGAYSFVGD